MWVLFGALAAAASSPPSFHPIAAGYVRTNRIRMAHIVNG
jgi:hypothetical protein